MAPSSVREPTLPQNANSRKCISTHETQSNQQATKLTSSIVVFLQLQRDQPLATFSIMDQGNRQCFTTHNTYKTHGNISTNWHHTETFICSGGGSVSTDARTDPPRTSMMGNAHNFKKSKQTRLSDASDDRCRYWSNRRIRFCTNFRQTGQWSNRLQHSWQYWWPHDRAVSLGLL